MTSRSRDLGLLVLRAALGVVFIAHGWQKTFTIGHTGLTGFFDALGVPFAGVNAAIVMALELGGGIALLAGAATRVVSVLLALTMAVATVTVHLANGFFMATNGYEFTLMLGLASVALALTGAGAYSVDRLIVARWTGSDTQTGRTAELRRAA